MSTRSGKRIHSSPDQILNVKEIKTDRKTRSQIQKENCDIIETQLKKKHYVLRCPSEEEINSDASSKRETMPVRKSRRTVLKDHNLNSDSVTNTAKTSRRNKKKGKEIVSDSPQKVSKISKKRKPRKNSSQNVDTELVVDNKNVTKKKTSSGSLVVEDLNEMCDMNDNVSLDKSNGSIDSFHSAAGSTNNSPENLESFSHLNNIDSIIVNQKHSFPENTLNNGEQSVQKGHAKRSKSGVDISKKCVETINEKKNKTIIYNSNKENEIENQIFRIDDYDKVDAIVSININNNDKYQSIQRPNNSIISLNSTYDQTHDMNMSKNYRKSLDTRTDKHAIMDTTFEKETTMTDDPINITFDKETFTLNATFEDVGKPTTKENKSLFYSPDKKAPKNITSSQKKNTGTPVKNVSSKTNTPAKRADIKSNTPIKIFAGANNTSVANDSSKKNTPIKTVGSKNNTPTKKISGKNTPIKGSLPRGYTPRKSDFSRDVEKDLTHLKHFQKDTSMPEKLTNLSNDVEDESVEIIDNVSSTIDTLIRTNNTPIRDSLATGYTPKKSDYCRDVENDLTDLKLFKKESNILNKLTNLSNDIENKSVEIVNTTFDKEKDNANLDLTFDKSESSISSLISSDLSNPIIIDNSLEIVEKTQTTPLQREGTFTKESPEVKTSQKPLDASPGRTPFPSSKRSTSKSVLNVTRSVEKSRSSIHEVRRITKVMFCSPVNTPMISHQAKGKVIKSSLKGSNKSFIFNESVSELQSTGRKRSYTQSDAEEIDSKRKKLAERKASTDKPSRSRTSSASGKIQNTPTKTTPSKNKLESSKVTRKKLPNFAALHQKHFDKMESLDECQERKAKRARQMLAAAAIKEKDSKSKPETTKTHTLESLNPGYTRFGFKMNSSIHLFTAKSDANTSLNATNSQAATKLSFNTSNNFENKKQFLTTSKPAVKSKENLHGLKRQATLPSLTGTTVRKEIAKQTIMREKSNLKIKRNIGREENRTIIKGVRTNRRFELQMQMRNIN
ncbi:unnamed protein product [Leptosia nina]|uniref:Uncharacterized protein n=1 Tax=Leptosia nina TaxID=320188 RepID=A0AAV1JDX1_9NEOP